MVVMIDATMDARLVLTALVVACLQAEPVLQDVIVIMTALLLLTLCVILVHISVDLLLLLSAQHLMF